MLRRVFLAAELSLDPALRAVRLIGISHVTPDPIAIEVRPYPDARPYKPIELPYDEQPVIKDGHVGDNPRHGNSHNLAVARIEQGKGDVRSGPIVVDLKLQTRLLAVLGLRQVRRVGVRSGPVVAS